jgi:WD40 repeat protein
VLVSTTDEPGQGPPPVQGEESSGAARQRFTILRLHACGGLGQVSVARDEELHRAVALKEIRPDREDNRSRQRFLAEAEITGQLEHPGVVPVYALGKNDQGRPYYAMRFVHGQTLAEASAAYHRAPTALAFRALLRRFGDVCQAIAYAHSRGIIHRDLKPANIMLGEYGETLVLDWGLAKRLAQAEPAERQAGEPAGLGAEEESSLTHAGQVLGTPVYMAPEQAEGQDVGPAADVYSLGAVLYELLTGQGPYRGPSAAEVLSQVRQGPPRPPGQVTPGVPRSLEAVCQKAMARLAKDRYPGALELAREVERWLADEPVLAYRDPLGARAARWGRRHKPVVAGAAVLLLTAVAALALGIVLLGREQAETSRAYELAEKRRGEAETNEKTARDQQQRAEAGEKAAQTAQHQAEGSAREAAIQKEAALKSKGIADAKTQLAEERLALAGRSMYALQLSLVAALAEHHPADALQLLDDASRCPPALRDFTWGMFHQRCKRDLLTIQWDRTPVALTVAFSPDGKALATGDGGEPVVARQPGQSQFAVHLFDAVTGQERAAWAGHEAPIEAVAFSPDGKTLASASFDKSVRIWEVATGKEAAVLRLAEPVHALAFAPDGKSLVTGGGQPSKCDLRLWDLGGAEPKERLSFAGHTGAVHGVAFSPNGKTVATASSDTSVRLWDPATGKEQTLLKGHTNRVRAVAFNPDGKTLVSGDQVGRLIVWDLATRAERTTIQAHEGMVSALAFTPDGTGLASAGSDDPQLGLVGYGEVKLWDVSTGTDWVRFKHKLRAWSVAFSPDGKRLAVTTGEHVALGSLLTAEIKVWDATPGLERSKFNHAAPALELAFSPDGKLLATGTGDGTVTLWDRATEKQQATFALRGAVTALAFSPDGQLLAAGSKEGQLPRQTGEAKLWDVARTKASATLPHDGPVSLLVFSPDGRRLASRVGSQVAAGQMVESTLRLWDTSSGKEIASLAQKGTLATLAVFAPDSKVLAVSAEKAVLLWNASTGQEQGTLRHARLVRCLAFTPDSGTLAVGTGPVFDPFGFGGRPSEKEDRGGDVVLWETATGKEKASLGHTGAVDCLTFTANGKELATGTRDHLAVIWDLATHQQRAVLKGHREMVRSLAYSPDEATLATTSRDKTVRLWQVATGQTRATLPHGAEVEYVKFLPDQRTLVTLAGSSWGGLSRFVRSGAGEVMLWDAWSGQLRAALKVPGSPFNAVAVTADGQAIAAAGGGRMVPLWTTAGLAEQAEATLHGTTRSWNGQIGAVAYSPDGRILALAQGDPLEQVSSGVGEVRLCDAATLDEIAALKGLGGGVGALGFSRDGKLLATGSSPFGGPLGALQGGTIKLWDTTTWKERATLSQQGVVWSVMFAPDDKTLAVGSVRGSATLWDLATLKTQGGIQGHHLAAYSPDGKVLATAAGNAVMLWDVATKKRLALLQRHTSLVLSLAFAPDGKTLVTGSWDKTVRVWDTEMAKERLILRGHSGWVRAVAVSPDGKRVASASHDNTMRLWDLASGKELATLRGHSGPVIAVAFAPDGKRLASASADETVKLWEVGAMR